MNSEIRLQINISMCNCVAVKRRTSHVHVCQQYIVRGLEFGLKNKERSKRDQRAFDSKLGHHSKGSDQLLTILLNMLLMSVSKTI